MVATEVRVFCCIVFTIVDVVLLMFNVVDVDVVTKKAEGRGVTFFRRGLR